MLFILTDKLFSKTKINHIDTIYILSSSDQKIIRFYISVQDSSIMHKFDQFQHFKSYHDSSLQRKLSVTDIEQIFQRIAQKIHHHDITISFFANVEHIRNVYFLTYFFRFSQIYNKFRLKHQLRSFYTRIFHLQRHLRTILYILCQEYLSKCTFTQFLHYLIVCQYSSRFVVSYDGAHFIYYLYLQLIYLQAFKFPFQMFEPHSVRGLLSRRNQTRLHSQEQMDAVPPGGDPDMDSVVEAKLMIKDIEHKIDDIRSWRQNQKVLLQQRLANNQAISKVEVNQYLQYLNKEQVRQNQQRQKYLKKLNIKNQSQTNIPPNYWNNSDTNLFDYLANSNKLVQQSKYSTDNDNQMELANQNFFNQMQSMSENILKRQNDKIQPKNNESNVINKQLIKNQLQQIENQLREIEQLMRQ